MGERWIVAVALGGMAALFYLRRRMAPNADVLPLTGLPAPSPRVLTAANAIARAEGFFVAGSIPQRANNPGNLKLGGARQLNGITVFEGAGQGWAALYKQLQLIVSGRSNVYSLEMSLAEMGNKWAPHGGADANVYGAWARNVAGVIGVDVDTPLSQVLA